MKDKAKQLKETTTKNSKKMPSLVSGINLDQSANRAESLELLCNSHSALLSDLKGRLLSLEVYIDNYKQEFADQKRRLQDIECLLSRSGSELLKAVIYKVKEEMGDYEYRTQQALSKGFDEIREELYKSQSSQHSLINQRIDRGYQELQLLVDARGLDLDMKKIVDGLEETVHGLESKLGLRCDLHERTVLRFKERTECDIFNHIFVFRNEIEDIKKTRKLTEWLVVWGFTMALVAFAMTIINVIKKMFY